MVQNGKFAACASCVRVKALNKVDLPTLGMPTMPHARDISVATETFADVSSQNLG
jgi:hypothetical protein